MIKIKLANTAVPEYLGPKKNILCWLDSPTATTGFGTVAKNVLPAISDLNIWNQIDVLGINFNSVFYNKDEYPYTILPTYTGDKNDPYGVSLLLRVLQQKKYDILFVCNDTFVTSPVAKYIEKIKEDIFNLKQVPFKIVYYYPVDSHVLPNWTKFLSISDTLVAYNQYGFDETVKVGITPHAIISHGVDTKIFRPLGPSKRIEIRRDIFKIQDDSTYLWINVNRNSLRKDLSRTILAFSKFHQKYPKSKLYLHTAVIDGKYAGGVELDLQIPCNELGLKIGEDVMFPNNYSPASGVSAELLNMLYNSADAYITTTTGEGFGLTLCEAMSAGIPVVAPRNTSHPEILGEDKVRGYMYDCKELVLWDNSSYRPYALLDDIVDKMVECYKAQYSAEQSMIIKRALSYTQDINWTNIRKKWTELFNQVLSASFPGGKEQWI